MIEKRVEHVVKWLKEQVELSHTNGILVGLSGGIDSSVVACLIKRAFPENSIGVILPCKSNDKDKEDAEAVAKACGIDYIEVELSEAHTNIFDAVTKALGDRGEKRRLTDANLRARLRMSALYTVGNDIGYLVAGTDNAAELLTGYFTKYGDGGVDILPLAHLTKREVFEWAKYLGVPQSVIDRQPSAGLWEGQTDESEMGVTYDAIDNFIEGKPVSDEDREIIIRMNTVTEHKRVMPPMPKPFND
ncbi:MAG: NAD(+) synthase [Clostridiales bacterium]|nr:NAD(+) synthase [Clostridiales bacterium]